MIEVLLRVPDSTLIDPDTTPQLYEAIASIDGIWTGDPQPQTRLFNGYKLIVAKVNASVEQLEQLIESFSLDWTVLGAKDEQDMIRTPTKSTVLDFMPDIPITDDEGNITGWERPTAVRLGVYAGSPEWVFS